MALLEQFMDSVRSGLGISGYGENQWPPPQIRSDWSRIEGYRRRYKNDAEDLLRYAPEFNSTTEGREMFTPVPLARDIARISTQLLFSETPKITHESFQDDLDEIVTANMLSSHMLESGEKVATEGYGALRVFRDDEALPEIPIIEYVSGDQIIWNIRHGRFVVGGAVVMTRIKGIGNRDYYRLIEYHGIGEVTRELYRGTSLTLGKRIELNAIDDFAGLLEREETVPGISTLVRWSNVPMNHSDFYGLDRLLDSVDEGFSYGRDKMKKSVPIVFAPRQIASESGGVNLKGIVFLDGNIAPELGSNPAAMVTTSQPGLDAQNHIAMIEHTVNMTLELAGYSRATWGRDQGGSADSGKALKLRQTRTLMTRSGKDYMARDAWGKALAIALAMRTGQNDWKQLIPEIELGDGLPDDPLETAQELAILRNSDSISVEEVVRRLNPGASQEDIDAEIARLKGESPQPPQVSDLTL